MKPRMCCIEPSGALRLVLTEIARKTGWEIEACKNLEEAGEIIARPGLRLDLVVTTANLNTDNYADVVRNLRGRAETETIPIVLFTSINDDLQTENALHNGITEVFLKNDLDTFEIYLDSFFDEDAVDLSGKRILVLEDDKAMGEYLRALLTELRLDVGLFRDANAAYSEALETAYDLIITDLVLDENQSGVGFIRTLRQSSGKSAMAPILAMSGFIDDARRIEALRGGADAFLAKPIIASELTFHVRRLLHHAVTAGYGSIPGITLAASPNLNLTEREQLICGLVVAGHRDKQIARQIGISYWTVRSHLGHIFKKCSVSNRIELATKLRENTSSASSQLPDLQSLAATQEAVMDWLSLAAHVLHAIHPGVMVTDKHGGILFINPGFTEITGYSSEDVIGKTPRLLKSGRHPLGFYRDIFATLKTRGSWSGKIWNRGKAGNLFVEWINIRRLPPNMPMGAYYVAVIGDISMQHREIEDLRHAALHDPLTGLPNRTLLRDRAEQEISRTHRTGKFLGFAFIDIDNFKPINDMFGHEIGDLVLKEVAKRLSGSLRAHDTLARQGGDEFIALLPEINDRNAAKQIGQKLLAIFQTPITLNENFSYPLKASIGISLSPDDGDHFEELVARADKAMYRAKHAGGGCTCCFDKIADLRDNA